MAKRTNIYFLYVILASDLQITAKKMLINFSVRNFGSVRDRQTLSFEADKSTHLEDYYIIRSSGELRLLKLGLIYGANASGKTTILKALDFLQDLILYPEEKKTDELDFEPFLFDSETPKQSSSLSIEFIQNDIRYLYDVEFNKIAVLAEDLYFFNPNKANVFKRITDTDKQLSQITFGGKIKKDKSLEKSLETNTLWNNTVLGAFLKTNIEQKEFKDVIDWFKNHLKSLILPRTNLQNYVTRRLESSEIDKGNLINILKQADFNISDILINQSEEIPESIFKAFRALEIPDKALENIKRNPRKEIEFQHIVNNKPYFLPMDKESQGTQRYYAFAGLLNLLINKSITLPIDELESSLHPDLFVHFLVSFLINSEKSQIIATTHNREFLNNKDIFRNDTIWFTDKSETGATELYSLSDFDSSVVRDTSNIYKAYKAGKLGGIPNLGDLYIGLNNEN